MHDTSCVALSGANLELLPMLNMFNLASVPQFVRLAATRAGMMSVRRSAGYVVDHGALDMIKKPPLLLLSFQKQTATTT